MPSSWPPGCGRTLVSSWFARDGSLVHRQGIAEGGPDAGVRTSHPAPPAHRSRPVSGVPAATLGGRASTPQRVLHRELLAQGYRSHCQRIKMAIATLRRGLPINMPREWPPSPREAARWIIDAQSRRGLHATEGPRRLLEHCPELDRTHALVRQFDARDVAPLPGWLE